MMIEHSSFPYHVMLAFDERREFLVRLSRQLPFKERWRSCIIWLNKGVRTVLFVHHRRGK
ncbi:hypothetical protein Csa_000064 [Cucumis sativus]|nr:hypothetical protein Csa_000064 [Cucumis sativus]